MKTKINYLLVIKSHPSCALTLLVGRQEGHPDSKKLGVGLLVELCTEWRVWYQITGVLLEKWSIYWREKVIKSLNIMADKYHQLQATIVVFLVQVANVFFSGNYSRLCWVRVKTLLAEDFLQPKSLCCPTNDVKALKGGFKGLPPEACQLQ